MLPSFIVASIVFIALVSSSNAFHVVFSGAYCAPLSSLVTQPGTYASPTACSIQCSGFPFFSYVPSSQQCLCTNTCNSPVTNPGADSYGQDAPSANPTTSPIFNPTAHPTAHPTATPTVAPTTAHPTAHPSAAPTATPTAAPTAHPTAHPTNAPTAAPTTAHPTAHPTANPTAHPTAHPTNAPTAFCEVPGVYCGPYANLVTQPGLYATPDACNTRCASVSSSFHFFSYVPSTEQCLCATTCNPADYIVNPGANSYCIQPSFHLCASGEACANGVPQSGTYATAQLCADKCVADNNGYTFFNYDPLLDLCACAAGCVGPAPFVLAVNIYSIDGQSCTYTPIRLRRE